MKRSLHNNFSESHIKNCNICKAYKEKVKDKQREMLTAREEEFIKTSPLKNLDIAAGKRTTRGFKDE